MSDKYSKVVNKWVKQGDRKYRSGKYLQAIALYEKALKSCPDDGDLCGNIIDANYSMGNYEKAIESRAKNRAAHFKLGLAYEKVGNIEQSITSIKEAAILENEEAQKWLTEKKISWK